MPTLDDKLRDTPDGPEKQCTACHDWWPADLQFFHADPKGGAGLFTWCKACHADARSRRRMGQRRHHPTALGQDLAQLFSAGPGTTSATGP